jgi:hypothetical protein
VGIQGDAVGPVCVVAEAGVPVRARDPRSYMVGKGGDCLFWLGWSWVGDGDFDWRGVEGWGLENGFDKLGFWGL